jgi:hypothetical protein
MDNFVFVPRLRTKKNNLSSWLDSKVNDTCTENAHSDNSLDINYKNSFHSYYVDENDSDLKLIDESNYYFHNETARRYLVKYLFAIDQVKMISYVPPSTNRFHCLHLFKKMVDYSARSNKKYKHNDKMVLLVYPEMKMAFYEFCKKNST